VLEKTINEFARAFVTSMPTGKQNTFANRTLPDAVFIAIRTDQPVNLAGAFESPVKGEGFAKASVLALESYAKDIYKDFCGTPLKTYVIGPNLDALGEKVSLAQLLERLGKDVADLCQDHDK
jgi:CRISPR system Cascade subunit CasC